MLTIAKNWSTDRNPHKSKDTIIYKEPPLTGSRKLSNLLLVKWL